MKRTLGFAVAALLALLCSGASSRFSPSAAPIPRDDSREIDKLLGEFQGFEETFEPAYEITFGE